jgi:tetratricopeptide (TPR) repeat protein
MTEGQLRSRDDSFGRLLDAAWQDLREGLHAEAFGKLERALALDVGRPGTASALKCAAFWREREARLDALKDPWEQAEAILAQWRLFLPYAERLGDVPERCLFSLKQRVFTTALALYRRVLEAGAGEDSELLTRIGRCAKGTGTYDVAIEFLERANREHGADAAILAELADAYSLAGEERHAKVFFREAFFLDPQAVDLGLLESPLVARLVARLRAMGYAEPELAEWVPVYGAIWGVFSVRRELKPLELGRLKQAVFQLERDVRREPVARASVPRLINRYFWLIDHYRTVGEQRERVEEVLARVRELDPRVHRDYTT